MKATGSRVGIKDGRRRVSMHGLPHDHIQRGKKGCRRPKYIDILIRTRVRQLGRPHKRVFQEYLDLTRDPLRLVSHLILSMLHHGLAALGSEQWELYRACLLYPRSSNNCP